jgi:hypothetical protein
MKDSAMRFECSLCHHPGQPEVTTASCDDCHPLGDSPMHTAKGHEDCFACHKPHQWSTMPTGHDSCAGCHKAREMRGWQSHVDGQECRHCRAFKGVGATLLGLPATRSEDGHSAETALPEGTAQPKGSEMP